MSVLRPTCTLTLPGGQNFDARSAALVRMEIELSIGGAHPRAQLILDRQGHLSANEGDEISISLGDAGDDKAVFHGYVARSLAQGPTHCYEIFGDSEALSRKSIGQAYLQQSIGDIARDIISQGDATPGTIDATEVLDAYYLHDHRTLWSQLVDLADFGDYALSCDADGSISLTTIRSGMAQETLRYGADLLHWSFGDCTEPAWTVGLAHGAASQSGAENWNLLLAEPSGASTGEARRILGLARNQSTADLWNQARQARATRASKRGDIICIGRASLRPGIQIELTDLPDIDSVDAFVTRVLHRFDGTRGWLCAASLEGAP